MPQAILLKDVEQLGERGKVVDVSKGYLRNFLIPRKLAEPATKGRSRRPPAPRAAERPSPRPRPRRGRAPSCQQDRPHHPHQAGDDGRLFGSVTTQDIADAIKEARGLTIDRRKSASRSRSRPSAPTWSTSRSPTAPPRPSRPWSPRTSSSLARVPLRSRLLTIPPRQRAAGRRPSPSDLRPTRLDRPRSAPDRTTATASAPTVTRREASTGPVAPPQNLEAEQSVLGAVLLSDTALPALIIDEGLHPDDFYREGHALIYQAMLDLHTSASRWTR